MKKFLGFFMLLFTVEFLVASAFFWEWFLPEPYGTAAYYIFLIGGIIIGAFLGVKFARRLTLFKV